MRVTRIGGPSHLVELDGWRILIDPTFDPPGRRYAFGLGTSSVKTLGPAVAADDLGPIDLVLVSHDHHADNLDDAGRALLPEAGQVLTTASGAGRLGLANTRGLVTGQSTLLSAAGKGSIEVTATPCRHGPPLSHAVVGDVIGFALRRDGEAHTALWVTGDSVLYPAIRQVARTLTVDVAIVNAGGVGFGITGPLKYTMDGADAVRLITELQPRLAVPAHFSGWSHFRDGEDGLRSAVSDAPDSIRERIGWLSEGVPTEL
jgi:L-ascorbate metabolism protein UlaG (beta-lactamase superfamily)